MSTKAYLSIPSALATVLLTSGTVAGQGTCADLNITSLTYAAFNDSSIEVIAHTNPGTFFSYPTFALVNSSGDAVTYENVNFFGITSNDQTHSSLLVDGQEMPTSPFTGSLLFIYLGAEAMDTCVYPLNAVSLCPPLPCSPAFVYFYNTGSGVDATFDWTLTGDGGAEIQSGTLALTAATATDADSVCIPAGPYDLHMEQTSGPAGAFQYGISRGGPFFAGPNSIFFQNGSNSLPFAFFEPCIGGTNGVDEQQAFAPTVSLVDGCLMVTAGQGSALGQLDVLDASGRLVHQTRTTSDRATIDLRSQPAGIYLVRAFAGTSSGTKPFMQRIVLF